MTTDLIKIAIMCAAPAWLLVEFGKAVAKRFGNGKGSGFAWQWGLRLLSVFAGAACGWAMLPTADGAMAGASGGVLCASIVAAGKRYLRRLESPDA
jgi:hypothetical protein